MARASLAYRFFHLPQRAHSATLSYGPLPTKGRVIGLPLNKLRATGDSGAAVAHIDTDLHVWYEGVAHRRVRTMDNHTVLDEIIIEKSYFRLISPAPSQHVPSFLQWCLLGARPGLYSNLPLMTHSAAAPCVALIPYYSTFWPCN
ncbi:hypothetical protein RRG08_007230 [Elysia crispata]|uniref:Uncharacterized protein n=1 Tax=Elysia crispata TaxID=231223 RepID=A0AAE1DLB3_9GAST|nr:hypothetical protein RRG08_007230 [Elysia crispata]